MNPTKLLVLMTLSLSVGFFGIGCGGEEEVTEAPKQVVKKKVQKAKPKAKSVDELKTEFSFDDRIKIDELNAPRDEKTRIALLTFFHALLNVDEPTLKKHLSFSDKLELEAMVSTGLLDYMQQVSRVDLQIGSSPVGDNCAMAIFEVGMEYQAQLWYFKNNEDVFSFESVSSPPNLANVLSGDWIESYFALEAKQAEIAMQPDAGATYILAGDTDMATNPGNNDNPSGPSKPAPKSPGGPKKPGF